MGSNSDIDRFTSPLNFLMDNVSNAPEANLLLEVIRKRAEENTAPSNKRSSDQQYGRKKGGSDRFTS